MSLVFAILRRLDRQPFVDLVDVIRSAPGRISIALTHGNFRLLWIGALTSSIGTFMQKAAQAWLIVTMMRSKSAFFLGLDSFFSEVPILLFTMIGGVLADRHDRRHMILMSQIIQLLAALVLAILVYARRIQIAQVLALSCITGCVRAFGGPAYQSLITTLVDEEHLPNAIALNSIQFNLAQVIGPLLAGAVLAAFGIVPCFGLNAFSFLFIIAAVLALQDVHIPPTATESMVAQFRCGLRFIEGAPTLMTVIALAFFGAFFGGPLFTFLPVITRDVFQKDVRFYAQLMTFSGAGSVMGAFVVAWLGRNRHMGRILLILLAVFGTTVIGFGLSRNDCLSGWILLTGGLLFVMCSSLTSSLAQLLAPLELHGRVVSIYLFAFLGGSPLGNLASGWLVTQVGSASMMLVANGTALTLAATILLIRGPNLTTDLSEREFPMSTARLRKPQR